MTFSDCSSSTAKRYFIITPFVPSVAISQDGNRKVDFTSVTGVNQANVMDARCARVTYRIAPIVDTATRVVFCDPAQAIVAAHQTSFVRVVGMRGIEPLS